MTEREKMIEVMAPYLSAYGDDERIADALIAAGYGNVEEVEHRAEVAERALFTACVNLIKDEEDNVNMELLAHVVYTKYLRKTEKELQEERKDV